jgi:hypothetical protein
MRRHGGSPDADSVMVLRVSRRKVADTYLAVVIIVVVPVRALASSVPVS